MIDGGGAERRRSRRQLTLVAAGHAGSVLKELSAEEPTGVILKVVDPTELDFYKLIAKTNEGIKKFIPEFGGETMLDGERFLRLENVSSSFRHPYVIDCKIGTRTFVEKEAQVTKPREDLFKRAFTHYHDSLTEEEKEQGFITKHRWMSIHDENTTTQNLGFRIDGVAGKRKVEKAVLNSFRSREDVINFFVDEFIPRVVEGSFRPESTRRQIGILLSRKMRELRRVFEESPTLQRCEVIGCSLLFVADCDGRCGITMIDFAKTKSVPEGINIDHRSPWILGNHEDGILFGIDNLVSVFDEVLERTRHVTEKEGTESQPWLRTLFCMPFGQSNTHGEKAGPTREEPPSPGEESPSPGEESPQDDEPRPRNRARASTLPFLASTKKHAEQILEMVQRFRRMNNKIPVNQVEEEKNKSDFAKGSTAKFDSAESEGHAITHASGSCGLTKPSRSTIGIPADGYNADKSTNVTIIGRPRNMRTSGFRRNQNKPAPPTKLYEWKRTQDLSSVAQFASDHLRTSSAPTIVYGRCPSPGAASSSSNVCDTSHADATDYRDTELEFPDEGRFSGDTRATRPYLSARSGFSTATQGRTASGVSTATQGRPEEEAEAEVEIDAEEEAEAEVEIEPGGDGGSHRNDHDDAEDDHDDGDKCLTS